MTMNTEANRPCTTAACDRLPPRKLAIRCGSTGMIIPKARMSSSTVMKMKASAARRTGIIAVVESTACLDGRGCATFYWNVAKPSAARINHGEATVLAPEAMPTLAMFLLRQSRNGERASQLLSG